MELFQSPQGVRDASLTALIQILADLVSIPARGARCIDEIQYDMIDEMFQSPQGVRDASK